MNRHDFITLIEKMDLGNKIFALDSDYQEDSSIVKKQNDKWIYYFCERGGKLDFHEFDCESDALEYLFMILKPGLR